MSRRTNESLLDHAEQYPPPEPEPEGHDWIDWRWFVAALCVAGCVLMGGVWAWACPVFEGVR